MTQFFFPFTSIDGDRRYNAKDFATYFHSIFTDGVIATVKDKLRVSESETTGMHVVVNAGAAFIHGHLYLLSEPLTVDVTPGNSTGDRVDSIVLQLDHLERNMKILYKQNSTSVQRDENYWELQLATINVPRNATQVLNSQINDKRANESVAGYSKLQGNLDVEGMEQHYESLLQQLSADMTQWVTGKKVDFEDDWDSWFNATQATLEQLVTDMQGWTDDKQLEFQTDWDTWFATIQDALDGDTAGNLLSKINAHELKEATETELGHVRLSDIPIPTKEGIGLGNVDNVKQASKAEHDQLVSDFSAHQADDANPHNVTKTQVGLDNVDNVKQIPFSEKGQPKGVATLDGDGKVLELPDISSAELLESIILDEPTHLIELTVPEGYKELFIVGVKLINDETSTFNRTRIMRLRYNDISSSNTYSVTGTTAGNVHGGGVSDLLFTDALVKEDSYPSDRSAFRLHLDMKAGNNLRDIISTVDYIIGQSISFRKFYLRDSSEILQTIQLYSHGTDDGYMFGVGSHFEIWGVK